jgi:hypothetical protein
MKLKKLRDEPPSNPSGADTKAPRMDTTLLILFLIFIFSMATYLYFCLQGTVK